MKSFIQKHGKLLSLLGTALAFFLSRILYDQAGVIFQGDTYLGYWQFIDPNLLEHDLWRSIFYLHSQPPLMNLLTGIILQIFPTNHSNVFHLLYFISGLALAGALYWLGICMRFHPWIAAALSTWFALSPAAVLYEHWLTYTYPLTVAITLAGILLYQFVKTEKSIWGFMGFSLLASLALTWSLFHIVWLIFIAFMMYEILPDHKKTILVISLPILLLTGWYTKNLIQVGEFTGSSWAGMNLSRTSTFRLSENERKQLVQTGELSKFALLPPFRNPIVYLELLPNTPTTGIPLLDEPETSENKRNHHHLVYVEASKYYLRDAIYVIRTHPQTYLRSVGQAFYIYFHSPSDFDLTQGNRIKIDALDQWWNKIFYGQWKNDETSGERLNNISVQHVSWWTGFAFITVIAGSTIHLWRNRFKLSEPLNFLVLFMAFNILYVTIVGNFMDIGENNRFRFVIDPFISVLFVFFLGQTRRPKFQSSY